MLFRSFLDRLESQLQDVISTSASSEDNSNAGKIVERVFVDDTDHHHVIEIYAARIPALSHL